MLRQLTYSFRYPKSKLTHSSYKFRHPIYKFRRLKHIKTPQMYRVGMGLTSKKDGRAPLWSHYIDV